MHPLDDIIAYFSLLVKSISEKSGECGSIQPDSRDFAMLNINKYPAKKAAPQFIVNAALFLYLRMIIAILCRPIRPPYNRGV